MASGTLWPPPKRWWIAPTAFNSQKLSVPCSNILLIQSLYLLFSFFFCRLRRRMAAVAVWVDRRPKVFQGCGEVLRPVLAEKRNMRRLLRKWKYLQWCQGHRRGMHPYICIYMYIYIRICIYIYIIYVCMYTCMYVCMYVCIYIRTYIYIYNVICICII
jgi:hypothetical protein